MPGSSLDPALNMSASERQAQWLGVIIAVAVLGSAGVGYLLAVRSGSKIEPGLMVALVLVGLAGAFLVTRRPRHAISWVLSAAGIVGGIAAVSAGGVPSEIQEPSAWQLAAMLAGGLAWFGFLFLMLVLLPLWFPTGRAPSPRWRWVTWTGSSALAMFLALWLLQEEFCVYLEAGECVTSASNPLGVAGIVNPEQSTLGGVLFAVIFLSAIAATVSLVVRFRRAEGIERQQLKWLLYSVTLMLASIVLVDVLFIETLELPKPIAVDWVQQALWVGIPLSVVVAVLRYRLYEIDRIISRTVSYATLTALLVGVYLGGVVGLGAVVRSLGGEQTSPVVIAASTLAVAALFGPARRRIQAVIDRRFNRARYDAAQAVAAFGAQLRGQVGLGDISSDFAHVVEETISPSTVTVWLRSEVAR